jgi:ornithine cyclodeaminase/alanine dehydrogenase-like protein (mu-crystallin family)
MLALDARQTRDALPFEPLIAALRERFRSSTCEVPARHVHEIGAPGGPRLTSLLMPAWQPGQHYGVKIINIAPGNAARGLPGLHGSYLLFDATTGVPLAALDGTVLTARRTVAASALAASFLAREDARHLLVVGAGAVASLLPHAYRCVREIDRVSVWARRPEQAQALAAQWQAEGLRAQAVTDLRAACAEADIISCATLATEPVVQGAWLLPGSHLDLIGSFTPAMREADDACWADARVFVDTEEALVKSGDLLGPLRRGVLREDEVRGTLGTLCKGVATGRKSDGERTVFKSVGTALEDLAAAVMVLDAHRSGQNACPQSPAAGKV